ncbi:hypothetical protein BGX30_011860 [Mortierella sp. GBA39]|nr:hypothetical protein BGX30_011860 [Mortierella sp. GBA39]
MLTKVNVRAANGFKTVLDPLAASLEQCKLSQGLTLVMTVLPNKMKHLEFSEASVEFEAGWGGFRDTHLADLVDRCISTATQVMQLPQDHESLADQLVVQDLRAQTHQRLRICLCNVYVTDNYIKEQNERLARLGLGWIRLEREAR